MTDPRVDGPNYTTRHEAGRTWTVHALPIVYDDGGRAAAGYQGSANDCVARALAIATREPYQQVYDEMNAACETFRARRLRRGKAARNYSARTGIPKPVYDAWLASRGWTWTATMGIGTGCRVHLAQGELPMGRMIVSVSKHLVAVIDGVVHDTHDSRRAELRCVYGYWSAPETRS